MNFLAIPTLKNERACLRLPSSMMPRFSLKLMLARLRTGIASVGSRLRSAAATTASATLMSFFSTAPGATGFACAKAPSLSLLALRRRGRALGLGCRPGRDAHAPGRLRQARCGPWPWFPSSTAPRGAFPSAAPPEARPSRARASSFGAPALRSLSRDAGASPSGPSGVTTIEWGKPSGPPPSWPRISPVLAPPVRFAAIFWSWVLSLSFGQLGALQPGAGLDDLLDVQLEDVAPAELALGTLAPAQEHAEPAPALLQRELDLFPDLVVVGDRFLGLARERHPDRGHVDEDHHGPGGESALDWATP